MKIVSTRINWARQVITLKGLNGLYHSSGAKTVDLLNRQVVWPFRVGLLLMIQHLEGIDKYLYHRIRNSFFFPRKGINTHYREIRFINNILGI